VVVEEGDIVVREMNRVVWVGDWLAETDFTEAAPRSLWTARLTVPEVVLLFLRRFWLGWEVTGWEEQVEVVPIQEEEEEGMYRVVEDLTRVVEEEVATQIRQKRHTIFSSKERTAETGS
jgi:predicted PilT family ATPase